MKKMVFGVFCISLLSMTALKAESFFLANNEKQDIQISNLLANRNLDDIGMTPTAVQLKFYNGNDKPCWTNVLNYRDVVIARAGNGYGCVARINRIEIIPVLVNNRLETYQPITITIDTHNDSTQILIQQNESPLFDTESGLVRKPGTIKVRVQSEY